MGEDQEYEFNKLLRGLENEIQSTGKLSGNTMQKSRKKIFDMYQFAHYKICFSYIVKYLRLPEKKTRDQRDVVHLLAKKNTYNLNPSDFPKNKVFNNLPDFNQTLSREWLFCYVEDPIISFSDYPFHLRSNIGKDPKDGNNLSTFFKREGSNLYFPLNKNLFVIIQNRGDKKDNTFYSRSINDFTKEQKQINNNREKNATSPETHLETIYDRIKTNAQQYIAGSNKETIEHIIERKENSLYIIDPLRFVYENQTKKIIKKAFQHFHKKAKEVGLSIEDMRKCILTQI